MTPVVRALRGELRHRLQTDPSVLSFLESELLEGLFYVALDEPDEGWLSPRFASWLGYPDESSKGLAWWRARLAPEDAPSLEAALQQLRGDAPRSLDLTQRFLRADGSRVWLRSLATRVDTDGGPRLLGAHLHVGAETGSGREGRDHRANLAALDKFAQIAGHDLKTPLRGIQHVVGFLRQDSSEATLREIEPRLQQLELRVARVYSMLDGLLAYARAGHQADEPRPVADVVRSVFAAVSSGRRPEEAAAWRLEGADAIDPSLHFPGGVALEHIVLNLVDNAIRHHDRDEGTVTVAVDVSRGAGLRLTVTDDGPGIPPERQPRAFEIFRSLAPRSAPDSRGMGLAIAQRLAVEAGGTLTVSSPVDDGRGCRFELWLPHPEDEASR